MTTGDPDRLDVVIVGAGLAGIATAHCLSARNRGRSVLLLDPLSPMSLTSAQSGDNYRNWWPQRSMVEFMNHSIDLMEGIVAQTGNVIRMTRRGYVLATRRVEIDSEMEYLYAGYGTEAPDLIRIVGSGSRRYERSLGLDLTEIPDGVDIIHDRHLIRSIFPGFSNEIAHVLHIRRAGDISGQQLCQYMLEGLRASNVRRERARLVTVEHDDGFKIEVSDDAGSKTIAADVLVDAAGPFAGSIAGQLGVALPIETVLQQKIAFMDDLRVIPRDMPFAVDLDDRTLDWSPEERELLAGDEETSWLTRPIPGGIHCRPEGDHAGGWVKLGWAYNSSSTQPEWRPAFDPHFPEIVMRGAAALHPRLASYHDRMPRHVLYGGYYTKTPDNLPLIGPLGVSGAFIVGALSGFGTMAALAAGELCADWIDDRPLPDYAEVLSTRRLDDAALTERLQRVASRSLL